MENQNINLTYTDNSKKSKLFVWIATILLGAVVGLGAFLSTFNSKYQKSSAYSSNDDSYQITLSHDEFFNSSFSHLYQLLSSSTNLTIPSIYWGSSHTNSNTRSDDYIDFVNRSSSFYNEFRLIADDYHFYYYEPQYPNSSSLDVESLYFQCTESSYSSILSAIESDLPSSPSYSQQSWFDELISLLTGGIVGLAGGVGSGVSTLVSDIFISNGALSVFGGAIVVFAGVSLAIGLCRWVMNFLTSLGAKK